MGRKRGGFGALITWAEGILPGCIRLYAIGGSRLMLENYESISEMSDTRITVFGKHDAVEISGETLSIQDIRKSAMVIAGGVSEIVFLKRRTAE